MKIAILYILYLLCALIDMVCAALQLVCNYLNACASACSVFMNRAKRRLSGSYSELKRNERDKSNKSGKMNPAGQVKPESPEKTKAQNVVGNSKTTFMSELPVLKIAGEETPEPYKSEQLGTTTEPEFEEEDTGDNFDIEGPTGEAETDDFEPYKEEEEDDFTDNSSGVSFEELSEAIGVLSKDEPTEPEKEKTAGVLDAIDGTELFKFITINNTVYENAKMLMNSFRGHNPDSQEAFDIKKFLS